MAQRKKKLTKKKKHIANREQEAESDSGDFELAAEVKDDDSVSVSTSNCVDLFGKKTRQRLTSSIAYFEVCVHHGLCSVRAGV